MFSSKSFGRVTVLLPAAAMLLALPGCGSKVNADNYAKVQRGQTEAQVEDILGKPTSTETKAVLGQSGTQDVWKDGDKTITVFLLDGKVGTSEKSGF